MWKSVFMLAIVASGFGAGYLMRHHSPAQLPASLDASSTDQFAANEPKPPGYDVSLVLPPIGDQPGQTLDPQILGLTAKHYKEQAGLTKEPTSQEPPLVVDWPPLLEPIPGPSSGLQIPSGPGKTQESVPETPNVIIPVEGTLFPPEGTLLPPTVRLPAPTEEPVPPMFVENLVQPRQSESNCLFVNNRDIKLNFEVAKSGSSGIKAVELWARRLEQENYKCVDRMEGDKAPFPTRLWSEGYYLFRLVFISGTGVKSAVPDQKEPPDVVVCLDTTAPIVELLPPEVSPDVRGAIKLRWAAIDRHLHDTPIRLEYSVDGEKWAAINDDWLPNTRNYSWVVPEGLPSELHVRVQARDKAGNIGEARSPSKVPVDLTVPAGKITGLLEVLPQPRIHDDDPKNNALYPLKPQPKREQQEVKVVVLMSCAPGISSEMIGFDRLLASELIPMLEDRCKKNMEKVTVIDLRQLDRFEKVTPEWRQKHPKEFGDHFKADYVIDFEVLEASIFAPGTRRELLRGHAKISMAVYEMSKSQDEPSWNSPEFKIEFPRTHDIPVIEEAPSAFRQRFVKRIATDLVMPFTARTSDGK